MFAVAGTLLPNLAAAQMPVRSCESLSTLTLPHTSVTMAAVVAKAGFSRGQIGASTLEQAFTNPVAMCRVAATLRPSTDSDIKIEVWLPLTGWNGKFQGLGNGGQWGLINYPSMSEAIGQGYATASTDTGHEGSTASFAFRHPEKLVDYSYRSHHEMTIAAKAIVDAFYGTGPRLSIFSGCSAGGRQAISEASRYPSDYDAIVAGSSAVYKMQIDAARVALNVFVNRSADSVGRSIQLYMAPGMNGWCCGSHASRVPLSARGDVPRQRQHR